MAWMSRMLDDDDAECRRLVADLWRAADEVYSLRFQGQGDEQLLRDRLAECQQLIVQCREALSRRRQSVH